MTLAQFIQKQSIRLEVEGRIESPQRFRAEPAATLFWEVSLTTRFGGEFTGVVHFDTGDPGVEPTRNEIIRSMIVEARAWYPAATQAEYRANAGFVAGDDHTLADPSARYRQARELSHGLHDLVGPTFPQLLDNDTVGI